MSRVCSLIALLVSAGFAFSASAFEQKLRCEHSPGAALTFFPDRGVFELEFNIVDRPPTAGRRSKMVWQVVGPDVGQLEPSVVPDQKTYVYTTESSYGPARVGITYPDNPNDILHSDPLLAPVAKMRFETQVGPNLITVIFARDCRWLRAD